MGDRGRDSDFPIGADGCFNIIERGYGKHGSVITDSYRIESFRGHRLANLMVISGKKEYEKVIPEIEHGQFDFVSHQIYDFTRSGILEKDQRLLFSLPIEGDLLIHRG
jgi:hypothetical protein